MSIPALPIEQLRTKLKPITALAKRVDNASAGIICHGMRTATEKHHAVASRSVLLCIVDNDLLNMRFVVVDTDISRDG